MPHCRSDASDNNDNAVWYIVRRAKKFGLGVLIVIVAFFGLAAIAGLTASDETKVISGPVPTPVNTPVQVKPGPLIVKPGESPPDHTPIPRPDYPADWNPQEDDVRENLTFPKRQWDEEKVFLLMNELPSMAAIPQALLKQCQNVYDYQDYLIFISAALPLQDTMIIAIDDAHVIYEELERQGYADHPKIKKQMRINNQTCSES